MNAAHWYLAADSFSGPALTPCYNSLQAVRKLYLEIPQHISEDKGLYIPISSDAWIHHKLGNSLLIRQQAVICTHFIISIFPYNDMEGKHLTLRYFQSWDYLISFRQAKLSSIWSSRLLRNHGCNRVNNDINSISSLTSYLKSVRSKFGLWIVTTGSILVEANINDVPVRALMRHWEMTI